MIRYRAVLIDPDDTTADRAAMVQGNDRTVLSAWAEKVLKKALSQDARVEIFEAKETKIETIRKKPEAKAPTER